MICKIGWLHIVCCALVFLFIVTTAFAQEPIIYPAKGQSLEKMEKDQAECYTWAKKQTGFDPIAQQAPAEGPSGERVRGAARGAAGGALIGAAAGNAGKGAAIGAASGAVIGGIRKRHRQEQQAASAAAGRNEYNRAYGACLEGRGYVLK